MPNKRQIKKNSYRKGSVVPLFAILLPLFIALIAFAVDYGVIVVSRAELQNAADSASIGTLQTLSSSNRDDADLAAFNIISSNLLHGRPIEFDMQQDVEYGNWDADSRTFTLVDREGTVAPKGDTTGDTIPSSGVSAVRIRLTRTRQRGNAIQLFFAPLLGTSFSDIRVEAISASTGGCTGFVGLQSVRLHNALSTDSYNSDEGDYGSGSINQNGDVCSDGPVLLDYSGVVVNGDVQGSEVTIAQGSNNSFTGSQSTSSGARAYDEIDFSPTENNNDNDTIPERGQYDYRKNQSPRHVDGQGDFVLDGGQHLTLSPGTYHFRNMTVNGGARLSIDDDVTIYIEKKMTYDNGTSANPGAAPSSLKLFVGQGPVDIKGGHDLHAVIYAPEADVTVDNDAGVFGSIFGKTLTAGGRARLHYDESLASDDTSTSPPALVN